MCHMFLVLTISSTSKCRETFAVSLSMQNQNIAWKIPQRVQNQGRMMSAPSWRHPETCIHSLVKIPRSSSAFLKRGDRSHSTSAISQAEHGQKSFDFPAISTRVRYLPGQPISRENPPWSMTRNEKSQRSRLFCSLENTRELGKARYGEYRTPSSSSGFRPKYG
ncbi:hypothetical protein K469DRAFT_26287 [Zopfia rhizophila CBS 207.26]|uniref:Uncharacterized protein n=1 Tax=Zopfia rhizophila CBS 207.26 TaxID=1314779 RepID=A0A6A6EI01_9PEZI|nr:hypothetical protein K469DRAFT_26287 [Zopfia rhizophila CBS 207.26]